MTAPPPPHHLDYAGDPPAARPVSALRLAAACVAWSAPLAVALLWLWLPEIAPDERFMLFATACLGIPFFAVCVLAGLAILPPNRRWYWFLLFLAPLTVALGTLLWAATRYD